MVRSAALKEKDVGQQIMVGFGQVTLVFGQERGIKALARARDLEVDRRGTDVQDALGRKAIAAVLRLSRQMQLTLLEQGGLQELAKPSLEQGLELALVHQ